jgi:hypothetical protein
MAKEIILYTGDDEEVTLPHKWQICGQCEGHGTSSAYLGAFTRDDLDEEGPEFCEDYFAGRYDRACETCGGSGKVKVVDRDRTPAHQLKAYDEQCADNAEIEAIHRMERLMEGGWREEGWLGR